MARLFKIRRGGGVWGGIMEIKLGDVFNTGGGDYQRWGGRWINILEFGLIDCKLIILVFQSNLYKRVFFTDYNITTNY